MSLERPRFFRSGLEVEEEYCGPLLHFDASGVLFCSDRNCSWRCALSLFAAQVVPGSGEAQGLDEAWAGGASSQQQHQQAGDPAAAAAATKADFEVAYAENEAAEQQQQQVQSTREWYMYDFCECMYAS